jgi:oligopeptidase A
MPRALTPGTSPTSPSSPACRRTPSIAPPQNARECGSNGWLFKLDQPTYMTVMTSAESAQLRRDIYEAWVTRASELGPSAGRFDNNPIIAEILPLRHELAQLLGFPELRRLRARHAHGEEQQAGARLPGRSGAALPAGGAPRVSDLEEFAGRKLEAWDLAFFSERLQESRFKVSQEALRPYFPLPKVLSGLFTVTRAAVRHHGARAPGRRVWHPSVRYYDLADRAGEILAGFYLDPYSRAEKRSGAWMDECVVAKSLPSGKALPVAQLVCNFTAPVGAATLAAHARRGDHAVPRVRPRPASHADARGLPEHRRASTAWRGTRWSCRASSWRTSSGAPRCCRSYRRT